MHRLIYYFSITSDIVLRRYDLILFKLENDCSGQAVETGKVHKILNKKWILGYTSSLHFSKASNADVSVIFWLASLFLNIYNSVNATNVSITGE